MTNNFVILPVAMCVGLIVCRAASASIKAGLAASNFSSATTLSACHQIDPTSLLQDSNPEKILFWIKFTSKRQIIGFKLASVVKVKYASKVDQKLRKLYNAASIFLSLFSIDFTRRNIPASRYCTRFISPEPCNETMGHYYQTMPQQKVNTVARHVKPVLDPHSGAVRDTHAPR